MRLYGRNPVIERLKSNPASIRKIYIQHDHADAGYVRKKVKKWGIPVYTVPKSKIQKIARNINTQGILGEIDDFPYMPYDELLTLALKEKHTMVFLDDLNDPQNLGGIIRSLAGLGRFLLVLPAHHSVEVTDAVLRVACGGENYIHIAKVSNLSRAVSDAKETGFWIAGAVVNGGEDLLSVKLPYPLALIIGSEQKGIREGLRKQVDMAITIPMARPRLSLNVAHAATLLCYEIKRQRGRK